MADVDGTGGAPDPEAGNVDVPSEAGDAAQFEDGEPTQVWTPYPYSDGDTTSRMMDDIFRDPGSAGAVEAATHAFSSSDPVEEGIDPPVDVAAAEEPGVEAEVVEDAEPEPFWRRKWFIAVVAALIGLAIGGVIWGASMDQTTVEETPPLVATPGSTAPSNPEVTVTQTANATATETKKIETTATETAKVQVTATETTKVSSTATETVNSTATETVKVPAEPAPTVTLIVTDPPVRENTQGLTVGTATQECEIAAEATLKSTYPDSEVLVPRAEALVAAIRSDLDAWFIKVGATVDGSERIVDCSVSGSEAQPSVDSVKLR